MSGRRQQVAHGVDPAPLPGRSLEDPADSLSQPGVSVGDDQTHPGQAPVTEVAQELGPKRLVFGIATSTPRTSRYPSARSPVAITTALDTTWWFSRTWR